jgi:hypothetical protein
MEEFISQQDTSWHYGKMFIGSEKFFDSWLCWVTLRILILTLKGIKIIATKPEAYEWYTVQ